MDRLLGDQTQDHLAYGKSLLDVHANEGSHGKTTGIGHVGGHIVYIANDLPDGQEPYQSLKKSQEGGDGPLSAHHKNDPDRREGNVADPCEENQQWNDYVIQYILGNSKILIKKLFHNTKER